MQRSLRIQLVRGKRHASHSLSLTGTIARDREAIMRAIATLRAALPELADDPHLLLHRLAVGNLWYLNYSDRPACRMTGMTRFATFWVEKGKVVAPVNVLRFDDTLYRMLGSKLEALTAETELLLDSETYGERGLRSSRLPGALVSELSFTL
jgi:hypothetical protein